MHIRNDYTLLKIPRYLHGFHPQKTSKESFRQLQRQISQFPDLRHGIWYSMSTAERGLCREDKLNT